MQSLTETFRPNVISGGFVLSRKYVKIKSDLDAIRLLSSPCRQKQQGRKQKDNRKE
jgi:hypothetical protein